MRNCIARYARYAAEGQVRLFSVRTDNDRRICDIGIRYAPDLEIWQILDVKGPCNSPPPKGMERLAEEIALTFPPIAPIYEVDWPEQIL